MEIGRKNVDVWLGPEVEVRTQEGRFGAGNGEDVLSQGTLEVSNSQKIFRTRQYWVMSCKAECRGDLQLFDRGTHSVWKSGVEMDQAWPFTSCHFFNFNIIVY
jgi:hypothetical protein